MRAYVIEKGGASFDALKPVQLDQPQAGAGEVLVRMRAAAINYRDLAVVTGAYFTGPVARDTIPLSDGAGEVVAVGAGVDGFAPGDRVCATFFANWDSGDQTGMPLAHGSPLDGTLAEYRVFPAGALVKFPDHLTFEEAATLPCAGVTAWRALMDFGHLTPGQTVLCLGTGGVSIFALQFARMAGARVVITSSSDEKLARARDLGAALTVNYRQHPEWQEEVLRLTDGAGADRIVEVGGAGTLPRSYQALGFGGHIVMVGVLSGPDGGNLSPQAIMRQSGHIHGVFVGPRSAFTAMNRAIAVNNMRPVVDRVFAFDQAREAFEYQRDGKHFGKVVIAI